ncbi:flagellar protein FlgN [Pseudomonas plecoglossicida]|uniref:Flagellar protein FlgN n=1 Tax=Pseudomonas plecoglossicida TaxID=70775 RepID=A0AAD0R081_PSEDL|nr:flagellar protein FlgN [Pseudomonas plecoglossicida]
MGEDFQAYNRLVELMNRLHGLLLVRDAVQIDISNQQITALLDAAVVRVQRRRKVMEAFRLPVDEQAMEKLFGLFEPGRRAALLSAWSGLRAQVERCRVLNERNGKLLAMQSEILQRVLDREPAHIYQPSY